MDLVFKPHSYQEVAIKHVLENETPGLFLSMGLGKTAITLTAMVRLLERFEVSKILIVAPKLVAEQSWLAEVRKWEHTKHLRVSVVAGSPSKRLAALRTPAEIYTIGRDNIKWLVDTVGRGGWDFDMLVLDELTSFKNHTSQRFKALRKVSYLTPRRVGLTGTPAPNSFMDLWSQLFLLDGGERLGKTITSYREAYFVKDYNGFGYSFRDKYAPLIHDKISDICLSMQAVDHLDMPERIDNVRKIKLKNFAKYQEFKRQEVLRFEEKDMEITPMNAAAMYAKLLQFSNGAVYDEDKEVHLVDDTKLDMLEEMVEELNGEPLLVFYSFQSDRERILRRIKSAVGFPRGGGGVEMVEKWNRREVPVLVAHPASIGHGLNLQYGGRYMAWFGLPWSLELYLQAVARLDRQGQTQSVINTLLIAEGTVEELVLQRLNDKTTTQDELLEALKKHLY